MNIPGTSSAVSAFSNADYLLRRCWRIQDCHSCLHTLDPCSWCAVSSTCIPNEAPIALLAPIWNPNVCPIGDERWELRAKGFGCKVSTITFLSVLVAILGAMAVALWIWAVVEIWAWCRKRWRKDRLGVGSPMAAARRIWKRDRKWGKSRKEADDMDIQDENEHTRLLA